MEFILAATEAPLADAWRNAFKEGAEIVETGGDRHPFVIAAPTMRVPMILDRNTVNSFLATRAALLLVTHGRFRDGMLEGANIRDHVRSVAFPGMGTGVGQVPAKICARQMRAAFDHALTRENKMPSSWRKPARTTSVFSATGQNACSERPPQATAATIRTPGGIGDRRAINIGRSLFASGFDAGP